MFPYQKKDGPEKFSIGHPGLDNKIKTRRLVRRPTRRWDDDFKEFIKPGEVKERTKYDLMNNNSWMTDATKREEWKKDVYEKSVAHFPDRRAKRYKECFALTHPTQKIE